MVEQHDDHCWIVFHGADRRIVRMNTTRWVETRTRLGAPAIVDLSRFKAEEYLPTWWAMLDEEFPGWR